jgi:hypothetical protein
MLSEIQELKAVIKRQDELHRAEIARLEGRLAKCKANYQTVLDERAKSFSVLDEAVGGTGLTEYQAEIDIAIEMKIKGIVEERDKYKTALMYLTGHHLCVSHPHFVCPGCYVNKILEDK